MQVSHGFPGADPSVLAAAGEALQALCFSGAAIQRDTEQRLAAFAAARHATLTGSGYAALQAALVAVGVRAGDRVLLPAITCASVWHAIVSLGAEPVPVDVAESAPLISGDHWPPQAASARFAVVPQMFGLATDLGWLHERGLVVIEDRAQSQSPDRDPRAAASVYSFSPTKLQTMGYGGAVLSDDPATAQAVRAFLSPEAEQQAGDGLPFRVHAPVADFQCAMLQAQLERYAETIAIRQHWVEQYDRLLDHPQRLHPTVPFRYLLRLPEGRDAPALAERLRAAGVSAWPLASQLLHQVFGLSGTFPRAEHWQRQLLSLPLHEGLHDEAVEYVASQVRELW